MDKQSELFGLTGLCEWAFVCGNMDGALPSREMAHLVRQIPPMRRRQRCGYSSGARATMGLALANMSFIAGGAV